MIIASGQWSAGPACGGGEFAARRKGTALDRCTKCRRDAGKAPELRSDRVFPPWNRVDQTLGVGVAGAHQNLVDRIAFGLAVSAAGLMVIVNTVVLVQAEFGPTQRATALALAAFGSGSMTAALLLPRLLDKTPDRTAMFSGATILAAGLFIGVFVSNFIWLLPLWLVIGHGYSLTQTPAGGRAARPTRKTGPHSLRPSSRCRMRAG